MSDDRLKRGMAKLDQIHEGHGRMALEQMGQIHPDFGKFVLEMAFGTIYDRPGLDLKTRQICTVAALAAMGNSPEQLKSHVRGALNVGWTRDEIVEVIMQMGVYGGVPAAVKGGFAALEVFDERGFPRPAKPVFEGAE